MYRGDLHVACNVFFSKKYLSVVPCLLLGLGTKLMGKRNIWLQARFMLSVSLSEELGNLMDNCMAEAFSRKQRSNAKVGIPHVPADSHLNTYLLCLCCASVFWQTLPSQERTRWPHTVCVGWWKSTAIVLGSLKPLSLLRWKVTAFL